MTVWLKIVEVTFAWAQVATTTQVPTVGCDTGPGSCSSSDPSDTSELLQTRAEVLDGTVKMSANTKQSAKNSHGIGAAAKSQSSSSSNTTLATRLNDDEGMRWTIPDTNWCGPGQKTHEENFCLKPGSDVDWACRRHAACAMSYRAKPFVKFCSCECDFDLYNAVRDKTGAAAEMIKAAYGPDSPRPCIKDTRAGWMSWLVGEYVEAIGSSRYSDFVRYGYRQVINNNDVQSKSDWPNCKNL